MACASCHKQNLAFGDLPQASIGVNGNTGRHSMRLVNARFSAEAKFFWDEHAATLEAQTTQPIQDHAEMGYSGQNGDPSINDLITILEAVSYYQELFKFVFGDTEITENRLQIALSQFVRSIQSFDSKYDVGRAQVANDGQPFPNFTNQENMGKNMFLTPPQFDQNGNRVAGGLGCAGCHRPPEFDIDPNSLNNGVIGTISGTGTDLVVTRSPTLRDVVKADGTSNGPFMHTGASNNLITVIDHYNQISLVGNNNLDPRLRPGGNPQNLQLMNGQKDAIVAFMRTLAGSNVYVDAKWSDPF
ncbi:MAG: cytochrome-c peroxidase [bacterium]